MGVDIGNLQRIGEEDDLLISFWDHEYFIITYVN